MIKGLMAPAGVLAGLGQFGEAGSSILTPPWGLYPPQGRYWHSFHDFSPHLEPVNEAGTDAWSTAVARFTSGESGKAQMEVLHGNTAAIHISITHPANLKPHNHSETFEKLFMFAMQFSLDLS